MAYLHWSFLAPSTSNPSSQRTLHIDLRARSLCPTHCAHQIPLVQSRSRSLRYPCLAKRENEDKGARRLCERDCILSSLGQTISTPLSPWYASILRLAGIHSAYLLDSVAAFSSPEAILLLVSPKNCDLWPDPIFWACAEYSFRIFSQSEVRESQTSQMSWSLVMTKRSAFPGDENGVAERNYWQAVLKESSEMRGCKMVAVPVQLGARINWFETFRTITVYSKGASKAILFLESRLPLMKEKLSSLIIFLEHSISRNIVYWFQNLYSTPIHVLRSSHPSSYLSVSFAKFWLYP